jgi:hypothetical protein
MGIIITRAAIIITGTDIRRPETATGAVSASTRPLQTRTLIFPKEGYGMAPIENPQTPNESSNPVLTLDDVAAVIVAVPPQSDELLAYFRTKGLGCRLQRGQGVRGQDVID